MQALSAWACSVFSTSLTLISGHLPAIQAHIPFSVNMPRQVAHMQLASGDTAGEPGDRARCTRRKWSAILFAAIPSSHVRSEEPPANVPKPCIAASTVSCTISSAVSFDLVRARANFHRMSPCSATHFCAAVSRDSKAREGTGAATASGVDRDWAFASVIMARNILCGPAGQRDRPYASRAAAVRRPLQGLGAALAMQQAGWSCASTVALQISDQGPFSPRVLIHRNM